MTTPDRLREAARVLRERAEAATPGLWTAVEGASGQWWVEIQSRADIALELAGADARYIATMSPPVALALADVLDDYFAAFTADPDFIPPVAFAVADTILGGAE